MSALILLVIVVAWALVVVPMLLNRHDAYEPRSAERLASAMRVLSRRESDTDEQDEPDASGDAVRDRLGQTRPVIQEDPEVEVEASRRLETRDGGDLVKDTRTRSNRSATSSAAPQLARRRRVLIGLSVLAAAQLTCALVVGPGFWVGQAIADLLLVGYVVHLRRETQRARGRRARELARTRQRQQEEARSRQEAESARAQRPAYSRAAPPPAHLAESAGREVVIEKAEDGSWHPVPVPVPTYVTAPPAPGMPTQSAPHESVEETDDPAEEAEVFGRARVVNE